MENLDERESKKEIIPNGLVRLSLSHCVKDILEGKIKEGEIKKIIARTNASPEQWNELIEEYKQSIWYKNPGEGEKIAQRLYDAGKIEQPRQKGEFLHDFDKHCYWISVDKEEDWRQKQIEKRQEEEKE